MQLNRSVNYFFKSLFPEPQEPDRVLPGARPLLLRRRRRLHRLLLGQRGRGGGGGEGRTGGGGVGGGDVAALFRLCPVAADGGRRGKRVYGIV